MGSTGPPWDGTDVVCAQETKEEETHGMLHREIGKRWRTREKKGVKDQPWHA